MIPQIQEALREQRINGWLFYDHHRRDPLAYRILGLSDVLSPTRRWYYYIPADGEPVALVHRIEPHVLQGLVGVKHYYSRWSEQTESLRRILQGAIRVAMQHSHHCSVPYVANVDAGTVDLVRSFGVDVVTSADLVQQFEARWSNEQLESHLEAGKLVDRIRAEAFNFIKEGLRAGSQPTEFSVQSFIRSRFAESELITDHGPIVAVNANASDPHYEPAQDRCTAIAPGDVVLIDMWAKLNRPNSVFYDITWTGFCGSVIRPEVQRIFDIVTGARDAAIDFLQRSFGNGSQIRGFEVDDAARGYIVQRNLGDYFFHRTGHSIGTNVHGSGANMDNYETHDERRVVPFTGFSVEPGVYLPEFGIRSEVNVFARDSDVLVTGEIQKAMLILA